jgi:hypothetical protein
VEDFASAVLVAAVRQVLAEQGLAAPAPPPAGALVPLAVKRRLLTEVTAAHGLAPLLSVGPALARLPPHPVIAALRAATSPADLFARWRKLERFVHSRHRVVLHHAGATCVVAEHVGPPHAPPIPAEDALILGVLTALLDDTGTRGLTAALDGGPVVFAGGVLTAPPPAGGGSRGRRTSRRRAPARRPPWRNRPTGPGRCWPPTRCAGGPSPAWPPRPPRRCAPCNGSCGPSAGSPRCSARSVPGGPPICWSPAPIRSVSSVSRAVTPISRISPATSAAAPP